MIGRIENSKHHATWFDRLRFAVRVQRYSLPFWHNILLRVVLNPVARLMPLFIGFVTRHAVNVIFQTRDVAGWVACAIAVLVAHMLTFFSEFVPQAMMFEMATRQELSLRDRLLGHVMKLSLRFHERRPVGENVFRLIAGDASRFTANITFLGQDAIDAVGLCAIVPVELASQLIQIAAVISVMAIVSKKIAVMIIAYVALYMAINHWVMSYVQRANRQSRAARQGVEARGRESLTLFKVTKAFGRQVFENSRFFRAAAHAMRNNVRYGVWNALYDGVSLGGMTPLFILLLDYVAGVDIFAGKMTPGDFALFPPLVAGLLTPVGLAYRSIQEIRLRFVAVDRVMETLEARPEIVDSDDAQPLPSLRGEVEFRNVTFGYDPAKPVLHNISFRVLPGQKVAFVGPSGAGKTSIVNLLMRFYDPASGAVLMDGKDIRTVRQRDLRNHVGLVLQDSVLFSGTIASNIRYGKPAARIAEVKRAAQTAKIHDFIETLPAGYETPLSESIELSGGQKQRIAIARAVIRDPRILILDEATAAVDPLAEREVIAAISQFAQNRTVVVVAHNLINVRDADTIFVVQDGRIVQEGTHERLMAREGLYRTLWKEEPERRG